MGIPLTGGPTTQVLSVKELRAGIPTRLQVMKWFSAALSSDNLGLKLIFPLTSNVTLDTLVNLLSIKWEKHVMPLKVKKVK